MEYDLNQPITQTAFAELVGISQSAVSALIGRRVLRKGGTAGEWIRDYVRHLSFVANERDNAELVRARTQEALANASLKKLRAEELAARLVDPEEVKQLWEIYLLEVKQVLEKLAKDIVDAYDRAQGFHHDPGIIHDLLTSAMTHLEDIQQIEDKS